MWTNTPLCQLQDGVLIDPRIFSSSQRNYFDIDVNAAQMSYVVMQLSNFARTKIGV